MMIHNNILLLLIITTLLASSCRHETPLSSESVLSSAYQEGEVSEVDQWIETHLTKPYNISVEYRWHKHSSQKDSYSYPPSEEKVLPVLEAVNQLAIEPFAELLAKDNLYRKVFPLRIYLYGGNNIHPIGIDLIRNTSAAPIEMHLYGVNDFDPNNRQDLFALCRSIYHQLALHLIEVVPYDHEAFWVLSDGRHTGSIGFVRPYLSELRDRNAIYGYSGYSLREGFFTLYSQVSARDEMAEILSIFFATTLDDLLAAYERASKYHTDPNDPAYGDTNKKEAEKAVAMLKAKEKFVTNYLAKEVETPLIRIQRKLHQARTQYAHTLSKEHSNLGD